MGADGDGKHGELAVFNHVGDAGDLLVEYSWVIALGAAVSHDDEPRLIIFHAVCLIFAFAPVKDIK